VAGAVASGARKITKGITGTVTGLFGGDEGPASKQASEGAASAAGSAAIREKKPAALQAEDQVGGQQETHNTLPAKPERAAIA
jgi:hypothetical protein